MTLFCKYRNLIGEPRKGVHSYRLGPFAAVDMTVIIILGCILGYFYISKDLLGMLTGFIILILLGVVVHYLFCVDTVIKF
jgi:hypothetical protein